MGMGLGTQFPRGSFIKFHQVGQGVMEQLFVGA